MNKMDAKQSSVWQHRRSGDLHMVLQDQTMCYFQNMQGVYTGQNILIADDSKLAKLYCYIGVPGFFAVSDIVGHPLNGSCVTIYKSLLDGQLWIMPFDAFHNGQFINFSIDQVVGYRCQMDKDAAFDQGWNDGLEQAATYMSDVDPLHASEIRSFKSRTT